MQHIFKNFIIILIYEQLLLFEQHSSSTGEDGNVVIYVNMAKPTKVQQHLHV